MLIDGASIFLILILQRRKDTEAEIKWLGGDHFTKTLQSISFPSTHSSQYNNLLVVEGGESWKGETQKICPTWKCMRKRERWEMREIIHKAFDQVGSSLCIPGKVKCQESTHAEKKVLRWRWADISFSMLAPSSLPLAAHPSLGPSKYSRGG